MECLCSINNQHVGVNLKACAVIMMDAWVTVPLQRGCQCKKNWMLMESSLSWSLVFTICYQTCFGVVSQRPTIGFPMKLSPGMRIATCWVPTETGWGLTPTRDTVQRQQRCSRNHSLPRNQEMALTSGCEIKMGRGKKSHGRKEQL